MMISSETTQKTVEFVKKLTERHQAFFHALRWLGAYWIWTLVFRLIVLTFITYFVMSSAPATARFEDVIEAFGSSELNLIGLGSMGFILLVLFLQPLTSTRAQDIFTSKGLREEFAPGFAHGLVLSIGVILAFLISGSYLHLGFFIQVEEASLAIGTLLLRTLCLILLAYGEEFIFRRKILGALREGLRPANSGDGSRSGTGLSTTYPDLNAVVLTAIAYVLIKAVQFDLGWMQSLTLFLMGIALGIQALTHGDFRRGAGFWAAVLIAFHPVASLPIFGTEFSGIALLKHHSSPTDPVSGQLYAETIRFLSGGAAGPLSSFVFQILLGLEIIRNFIRYRKSTLSTSAPASV